MKFNFKYLIFVIVLIADSAVLFALILGKLGKYNWWFDLFSHFQMQYFIAFFVLGVILLVLKKFKYVAVSLIGVLLTLLAIMPVYIGGDGNVRDSASGRNLSVQYMNINVGNDSADMIIEEIRSKDPDVLFIIEANEFVFEEIKEKLDFEVAHYANGPGAFSMAMFSKLEVRDIQVIDFVNIYIPSIVATLRIEDKDVCIIGTHPVPPMTPMRADDRNQQLLNIAEFIAENPIQTVLVGDFNMTPYSPYYSDILDISGLKDSRNGFGIHNSWPVGLPWIARIPIDHAWVSEDIIVLDREIGLEINSDHLPVYLRLNIL
ncbi:MAG: endonuclease/exonuclease/phosphatase family protein [Parcubacteria group bacterium]